MTAPISVAQLALDSSGIAQAMNEFNTAIQKFQQAVDAAGQHAQKSSQHIDQIADSAKKAGDAAEEHLGRARAEAERGNQVFEEFSAGIKSYALSFATFEAVKRTLEGVVDTLVEAEYADARLNAVLRATGGVAGQTTASIEALAKAISGTSIFDSTQVKEAAAQMLTFDNVRGPVFARAMKDAADLASLMGGDLPRATLMLGRSLESPAAGFMMLRMAGIVFTAQEKEELRVMEAHNRIADAQAMILKKVEASSNDAAKALRDTLGGAFAALTGNIKESIEQLKSSDGVLRQFIEGLALLMKPASSPLEAAQKNVDLVRFGIANAAKSAGMTEEELERRLRAGDTSLFGGFGLGRLLPGRHFPLSLAEFAQLRNQLSAIAPQEALLNATPMAGAMVTGLNTATAAQGAEGGAGAKLPPVMDLSQEQQNALRSLIDSMKEEILTVAHDTQGIRELRLERAKHAGEIQHATTAEYNAVLFDLTAWKQYRKGIDDLNAVLVGYAQQQDANFVATNEHIKQLKLQRDELKGITHDQAGFNAELAKGNPIQQAHVKLLEHEILALQAGQAYWKGLEELEKAQAQVDQQRFRMLFQGVQDFQQQMAKVFGDGLSGSARNFRGFTIELLQSWEQMLNKMVADWLAAQATMGLLTAAVNLGVPGAEALVHAIYAQPVPTAASKLPSGIPATPLPGSVSNIGKTVIVQAPVHFTVQAIDSASFQSTLAQHAATIQTIVVRGVQQSRRMAASIGASR